MTWISTLIFKSIKLRCLHREYLLVQRKKQWDAFYFPLALALLNNPEGQSYQWVTTWLIKYKSEEGLKSQGWRKVTIEVGRVSVCHAVDKRQGQELKRGGWQSWKTMRGDKKPFSEQPAIHPRMHRDFIGMYERIFLQSRTPELQMLTRCQVSELCMILIVLTTVSFAFF